MEKLCRAGEISSRPFCKEGDLCIGEIVVRIDDDSNSVRIGGKG